MKKRKRRRILLLAIIVFLGFKAMPQLLHKNSGTSMSVGRISSGKLINAYKLPYKGENFKFFSPFSYYILGRAYMNSAVCKTVTEAYKMCENDCPGKQFRIMECSKKKGGKAFPHITHQNGLCVDFMTPLKKKGKQHKFYDKIGIWRYLMDFNSQGKANINKNIEIDFNTMAQHIINLDIVARKNGLRIRKVIFKINLKDDLFKSEIGKKLKKKNIYFVNKLTKRIDNLHDDHYHIDFTVLK